EILGGKVLAAFVEQDEGVAGAMSCPGSMAKPLAQALRLLALATGCIRGAALRDLGHAGEFEADRRPRLGKAVEIAPGEFPLRTGLQPAYGMNLDAHDRL